MTDYIAEAITELYGERCADVDQECHCCKAWAQYDAAMWALHDAIRDTIPGVSDIDVISRMIQIWAGPIALEIKQRSE